MKKTITTLALGISIFAMNFTILNAQTYFSDDFENGLGNWIVGGNNWDTLSTTYTSSNHCVTDSRVGNYTYNSDPTITMSGSVNLTSSSFPVLAFFHKFAMATGCGNDYIYLEISTNNGFNWSQLKSWTGSNRAWYYEQINFTNYRKNLVKIRFRLSSHNSCGYTADGWYVDDVKMLEFNTLNPPISFPFSDNFESGLSKWLKGTWDSTSAIFSSPIHSVTDSRVGNYLNNSAPTITMSGVLNLKNIKFPVLTFFHRYSLATGCGNDFVNLDISTNGGFNWIQIRSWQGSNVAWTYEQIDLSNYDTSIVKIRFRLSSYNTCGYTADGWFIDDVSIRDLATGVTNINSLTPDKYSLNQNYPNPFNPTTNILFAIPKNSNVTLKIFDMLGREVATLVNERLSPGTYSADWNAGGYPSGVYFYKLETEGYSEIKKMILTK